MSSSNIVTADDFDLLLGGLESFYNAQPATTSRVTTAVVASPESTHAQLPTVHQSHDEQQQLQQHQQQQSSPRPQLPVLDYPSPDRDLSRPDSAHGTADQSIWGASTTTLAISTKATTKSIQSPPLCTNAAEFIANNIWHIPAPAPTSLRNKDSQLVASTHLLGPSTGAPHTIRHRSVDSHPTQDHHVEHKQPSRCSTVPKEDGALNGYSRHHRRFRSDPYTPADLLPGADDCRASPAALEVLLDGPHETVLTEKEKRALIEYGRAIGNSGTGPLRHYHGNNNTNNRSNNKYSQQQKEKHANIDMSLQRTGERDYRSKITYSRDFLMSFRAFDVPPKGIDRIHWIQQNPTLDHPQKAAGPRMARPQPAFQEPRGDYQGAGNYDPDMGHRQSGRGGGFRKEGAFRDVGFGREIGLRGERGQSTAIGNGPSREGAQGTSRGGVGFRGERGQVPRLHFQQSSATATGGLSGSVFSFKTRGPLGPPAAPRSGSQMRGFKSRTTL
ncbi:hypothetical protein KI688_000353 [Linnemannia hyalina]|uniref:Uncharacterized protein n=1 Tax=Linnemannia hyalina TaxID=64524 RepID=A0A9P8BZY0_9FUNG|nr:hypothetical protein KI688_000353 [Linnemannia hyalina]